jgi:hypothetical protein
MTGIGWFILAMLGIQASIAVVLNMRRNRRIAEWRAWAEREHFAVSGAFPAFTLRGRIEGYEVTVEHRVELGAKGSTRYSMTAVLEPARDIGALSVIRRDVLSALWRRIGARDETLSTIAPGSRARGELSIADTSADHGALSMPNAGEGALSIPEGDVAPVPSHTSVEDFTVYFDVRPSSDLAMLPIAARRALLDAGSAYVAGGRVRCDWSDTMTVERVETMLAAMARIAKGLEEP